MKMKISITASILILLFAAIFASCSGAFLDPGIMEVVGLGAGMGSGGGGRTPVAGDYTVGNLNQLAGSVTAVTIKANSGKSRGAVRNIRYSGSSAIPQAAGSYFVTFDVEKAVSWEEAYDLSAGMLVVSPVYTVTFNINGGEGTPPPPKTAGYNGVITIPDGTGITKTGYVFSGWNTSSLGSGTNYNVGTSYTVTGNVTLYAKWNSNGPGSELNPIPLTLGAWTDGNITTTTENRELWYSFDVTSGTTYYVWWNDSWSGNGTKSLDVRVSAYYSNDESIFTHQDNGWTIPNDFIADSTGTVKLRVYPNISTNTGTFAIAYSTNNITPTAYTVTFDINGGTGTPPSPQTANVGNSITLPDGTGFSRTGYELKGWNTNAAGTGTFYSIGSQYTVSNNNVTLYARWISTASGGEANPILLTEDTWVDGSITVGTENNEVWYSFDVTDGTTYYVWWNDSNSGGGSPAKTGDIAVSAYYSDDTSIFTIVDSAWFTPQSFIASSTGTVKLRVGLYNNSTANRGTFAVVYSTGSTRP
jgi:uncharacterized repeat protein (TIGR02543 family)